MAATWSVTCNSATYPQDDIAVSQWHVTQYSNEDGNLTHEYMDNKMWKRNRYINQAFNETEDADR